MKFRFKKVFCVAAVFLSLMLATCSDPSTEETGEGFFTINLSANENARAVYPPANPGDLKFTVKFKNTASGAVTTFITEGSGSIQDKIDVGNYIVTMDVTLISDGSLYARGVAFDNPVAIGSGQNSIRVYAYDVGKAEPPVISTKPSDSLNISISLYAILSGYSASISDGGTLSFQWFSNTTNSNSGGTPLPSGSSQTTGSTGSALTELIPATTPEGLTYYYAEITNSGGGSASGPSSIKTKPFAVRVINGKGTVEDPFLVYDVTSLQRIGSGRDNDINSGWPLDAHYKQVEDIDLASVANWTPIGSEVTPFTGSYDGNGKTISNLVTNVTGDQGLFGRISLGAVVKNIGLVNRRLEGNATRFSTGSVVGTSFGTVQNCYSTGTGPVISSGPIGGVVGDNFGLVQSCYNTSQVDGHTQTGGIVGRNYGVVQTSYNTGRVIGSGGSIGGVVGFNVFSVEDCYNTGEVSGDKAGGVVGLNSSGGIVQNCYNTGDVFGEEVGGVIGTNEGTVQYCYNTGNVSNDVSGCEFIGGVVAINLGAVQNCYATGDISGSWAAFVGGVVGWNEGTLQYCYTTGNISFTSPSSPVGGVVGYNFNIINSTVQNCVALNPNVSGTTTYIGRVLGLGYLINDNGTPTLANNYGRSDMKANGSSPSPAWTNDKNDRDGASITSANWGVQSWWTTAGNWDTAGWNFTSVWQWGGSLPILRNMPGTATQNPTVRP